jgi:hypothetical protein
MTNAAIRPATLTDLAHLVAIEIEAARLFPLDIWPARIGRSGSRAETLEHERARGLQRRVAVVWPVGRHQVQSTQNRVSSSGACTP